VEGGAFNGPGLGLAKPSWFEGLQSTMGSRTCKKRVILGCCQGVGRDACGGMLRGLVNASCIWEAPGRHHSPGLKADAFSHSLLVHNTQLWILTSTCGRHCCYLVFTDLLVLLPCPPCPPRWHTGLSPQSHPRSRKIWPPQQQLPPGAPAAPCRTNWIGTTPPASCSPCCHHSPDHHAPAQTSPH
jgi:hypothetical protein